MTRHTDAFDRYDCPDCRPDTKLIEVSPRVWVLQIMHDETCPNYRRMTT